MGITISLATPTDAYDMAEIHTRSWEAAYKDIIPPDFIREKNTTRPALWQKILTSENTSQYVIRKDGKTVGLMGLNRPNDDDLGDNFYELQAIYLHPDYFRQGVGTLAMNFAFDKARSLCKTDIVVWVLEENLAAIKFYQKFGFAADGKTKEVNYGRTLKLIRMRLRLI